MCPERSGPLSAADAEPAVATARPATSREPAATAARDLAIRMVRISLSEVVLQCCRAEIDVRVMRVGHGLTVKFETPVVVAYCWPHTPPSTGAASCLSPAASMRDCAPEPQRKPLAP